MSSSPSSGTSASVEALPAQARASSRLASRRTSARKIQSQSSIGESEKPDPTATRWRHPDKRRFLSALRRHGSSRRRAKALADEVGGKSEAAVNEFVAKLKRGQNFIQVQQAHPPPPPWMVSSTPVATKKFHVRRQKDAPIERWIELLDGQPGRKGGEVKQDLSEGLVTLLEATAVEEYADEKVDYGAIYRVMASLMAGDVPPDTNRATSAKLATMVDRLVNEVSASKMIYNNHRHVLESFRPNPQKGQDNATDILWLNPFHLPFDMFRKK